MIQFLSFFYNNYNSNNNNDKKKKKRIRSERNEISQLEPLFPRVHIDDTKEVYGRAPPIRNKMASGEESSLSMLPLPLTKNTGLKSSGSHNHVGYPQSQNSRSSLVCSLSDSKEMSEDHHSHSSRSEFEKLKTVDDKKVSSMRPSELVSDCNLLLPFSSFNSGNSSLSTNSKECNFRLPLFFDLNKTLESGCGIEDKLLEEKPISLSASGRREEVNNSDHNTREHHGRPTLFSRMKSLSNVAAAQEHPSTKSSNFGSRGSPIYQARYGNLANDKSRLNDPCEPSYKECRTSQKHSTLTDGTHEITDRFSKKNSHSTMGSSSSRDNEENNHPLRMESVNEPCTRDGDDDDDDDDDTSRRIVSISGALIMDSNSDSVLSPDDVVDILGQNLFWQVRKTIAHQQRIFAMQVFELHKLIKVQRLISSSPDIISEELLYIYNHSTKLSQEKELLPTQHTSSVMKPKKDSQRPNSRPETTAQDADPKLPLLECDTKRKESITPGQCTTTSSAFSAYPSPPKLGSLHIHGGNQYRIPVRSSWSSPDYANCGVPRLSATNRGFTMPTLSIQPPAIPVVETSNSSKSSEALKGNDVHESTVDGTPANRVDGDALLPFPVGSPFQASYYKEKPSNNTEMQQGMQVIKVIPHNPKSACESAARIFKSLQEERHKRK